MLLLPQRNSILHWLFIFKLMMGFCKRVFTPYYKCFRNIYKMNVISYSDLLVLLLPSWNLHIASWWKYIILDWDFIQFIFLMQLQLWQFIFAETHTHTITHTNHKLWKQKEQRSSLFFNFPKQLIFDISMLGWIL